MTILDPPSLALSPRPVGAAPNALPPQRSPLFERWVDPLSGVTSWILSRRAAPVQQSFYFTNTSFTDDGRYLWFYAAFPPSGDAWCGRMLAMADLAESAVRFYPETQFSDASPLVDCRSGEVYWASGLEIWKRGPGRDDAARRINALSAELARNRRPRRLATHLTFSADRTYLNIDAQFAGEWLVGAAPLDGGAFELWQTFDRCYNHGQFSPVDPDVQLIAQDFWIDPASGRRFDGADRLWLIRQGEKARPLCPDAPAGSSRRGHEWWDADGQHVWFVDYAQGTHRLNIHTGRAELIWPGGKMHSHCDRRGRWFVGDNVKDPAHLHWRVSFWNRATSREIDIVSALPPMPRGRYHVHPHPQFCCQERYVCYTTNVRGCADVALVAVQELLAATA